jgi:hypothetical protein
LQTNAKKGPKFGKIFNGLSTIRFSHNNENGKFQHGFKYGKCIKPLTNRMAQTKGNAIDDKFEVICGWLPIIVATNKFLLQK